MNAPSCPAELSPTWWERQAGPLAKARPATLLDALKAHERLFGALDFDLFNADKLGDLAAAQQRANRLDGDLRKAVQTLVDQARAVEAAAAKLDGQFRKDAAAKSALRAAAAIARAAAAQRGELARRLDTARAAVAQRLEALQRLASADRKPTESPERLRLKVRLIDQFRIVKNRPDRKVVFLLCVGRQTAAPYLGPSASDSHKPLLTKVLKGDTGFKFYRGECVWEDGGYTFVGKSLSSTLARRIERGIIELTGTRFRVRAHE